LFLFYFNLAGAHIAPSVYWGVVHGSSREEALEDAEGIYTVKNSARSMAWLIKAIALARKEIPLPVAEKRPRTNFIR